MTEILKHILDGKNRRLLPIILILFAAPTLAQTTVNDVKRSARAHSVAINNEAIMQSWDSAHLASVMKFLEVFEPKMEWSMTPRFGLDANNNNLLDVRNSYSYVHNCSPYPNCSGGAPQDLFEVNLSAMSSSPLRLFNGERCAALNQEFRRSGLPDICGNDITITGLGKLGEVTSGSYQPIVKVSARWDITTEKARIRRTTEGKNNQFASGAGSVLSVMLPEGDFLARVEIRVTYSGVTFSKATDYEPIKVNDILIAVIGDSYASGEGNPDMVRITSESQPFLTVWGVVSRSYRDLVWLDDGSDNNIAVRFETYGRADLGFCGSSLPGTCYPPLLFEPKMQAVPLGWPVPIVTPSSPEANAHARAHRSSSAWPVRVGLDLEWRDNKSSVTFVFLASSGATIQKGILSGSTSGSDELWLPGLPSQLDTLKVLVGRRQIDVLLVSVGGNDVGFKNLVTALAVKGTPQHSAITFDTLKAAIRTGKYRNIPGVKDYIAPEEEAEIGLPSLKKQYDLLSNAIKQAFLNSPPKGVFIAKYPDPTRGSSGTCPRALHGLGTRIQGVSIEVELSAKELEFASKEFLNPLNKVIEEAATANNWVAVSADFGNHGICEPEPYDPSNYPGARWRTPPLLGSERWVRRAKESLEIQGPGPSVTDTSGMLHPNEFGHLSIAGKVLGEILNRPNVIR